MSVSSKRLQIARVKLSIVRVVRGAVVIRVGRVRIAIAL